MYLEINLLQTPRINIKYYIPYNDTYVRLDPIEFIVNTKIVQISRINTILVIIERYLRNTNLC